MRRLWPLVLLAACGGVQPPVALVAPPPIAPGASLPDAASDTCGATPHAGLVGQPATALERVLIMRPLRILRPGDPVTGDVSPARLNILIDGAERIARLTCG